MQTKTPDLQDAERSAIIQLGQRALAQLTMEAKAARIQARQAELEMVMEQAQQGNVGPLQEWLRHNGQTLPRLENVTQQSIVANWDSLIPSARLRLAQTCDQKAVEGEGSKPSATSGSTRQPAGRSFATGDIRADVAHKAHTEPIQIDGNSDSLSSTDVNPPSSTDDSNLRASIEVDPASQVAQDDELSFTENVVKQSFDGIQMEDDLQEPVEELQQSSSAVPLTQLVSELGLDSSPTADPVNKGRWRGVIVSTIFHVLLLVVLALMSLKNPVKDGLLSLVSGGAEDSTEMESFELTNDSMVEPSESTAEVEPTSQTELSEILPGLSDAVSESLSESLATSTPAASRSNLMAAKAGPAKNVMSFYGAESTGNSFCFVLDGSGSMRGGPWEAARQELLKSIASLKQTQRFYIIFFNKDVLAITSPGSSKAAESPLAATPENLAHAKRWLDTLQITTGEPPMKALEAALAIECDCVYFLADGEMSDSVAKRLLDMLHKKNRTIDILDGEVVMIPIHTIAYYSDKGLEIMRRIAHENRGQFTYVPKPRSARSGK